MQRNFAVFVAAGLATAALATAAMAGPQGADQVSTSFANPPQAVIDGPLTPLDSDANLQASYDHNIMMLKKKMERLTREDGGQLSATHQASLQKELDDVNRHYRDAARFAQR